MTILKCKMCGGELTFEAEATVCECEYCGSKQTIPAVDDEKKLTLYDRANKLRMNCEFDKAASVYESIVTDFRDEAEGYWGILLCKYGIEYVDDPATGKKVPTCHRSSFDSIMDDSDFDLVMENADNIARGVYREQAKQIEEIRKGIIEVSGKEEPYDIFICYKETAEDGQRTIDSVIAQDVYNQLTSKGYRVFFSRITLEDKLGAEYEPYIFAALNSAKIMLAFGTSYDYYNAVWVKNEWSRYIKLMAKDKEKHLIPCYKDIDAYDIPKEFKHLQAQDLGKVGAVQDLMRGISKIIGTKEQQVSPTLGTSEKLDQTEYSAKIEALIKRGYLSLGDEEYDMANELFGEALNLNAECAEIYLGIYLAKKKVSNLKKLKLDLIEGCKGFGDWDFPGDACEEASDRIDNAVKKYAGCGGLNYIVIKDIFAFDRSFNWKAPGMENHVKSLLGNIEKDKDFSKAKKYAKGKTQYEIESFLEELSNELNKMILKIDKENEKCIDEIKRKYAEHLDQADIKVKQMWEKEQCENNQALVQATAIIKTIENSEVSSLVKAKQEYEKQLVEYENQEKKYISLLADFDRLFAEYTNLKNDVDEKKSMIGKLVDEKSHLGIFSGKRKKEIDETLVMINAQIPQLENKIKEYENQYYGMNLNRIKSDRDVILNSKHIIDTRIQELNEGISIIDNRNTVDVYDIKKIMECLSKPVYFEKLSTIPGMENIISQYNLLNATIGSVISWGGYSCKVLDKNNNKLLLITNDCVELRVYHEEEATWEISDIRYWLNFTFINRFSSNEQEMILVTDVINSDNEKYGTPGGNDTQDKIFLLSIDEANKYFSSDSEREAKYNGKAMEWYLRSSTDDPCGVESIEKDGSISKYGEAVNTGIGIRPAFWVDLSKINE